MYTIKMIWLNLVKFNNLILKYNHIFSMHNSFDLAIIPRNSNPAKSTATGAILLTLLLDGKSWQLKSSYPCILSICTSLIFQKFIRTMFFDIFSIGPNFTTLTTLAKETILASTGQWSSDSSHAIFHSGHLIGYSSLLVKVQNSCEIFLIFLGKTKVNKNTYPKSLLPTYFLSFTPST